MQMCIRDSRDDAVDEFPAAVLLEGRCDGAADGFAVFFVGDVQKAEAVSYTHLPCGGDLKEVDQPEVQPERIAGGRQQKIDQRLKVVLLRQLRALQGHAAQNLSLIHIWLRG